MAISSTQAYFRVAQALMPGARLLTASPKASPVALSMLSASILECLLKAFLSRKGLSVATLSAPRLGHNLANLWTLASTQGLNISALPPAWAARLNQQHGSPDHLRYTAEFNAPVLPELKLMSLELDALLARVHECIR